MKIDVKKEAKSLGIIIVIFLVLFYLPLEKSRFQNAIMESLALAKWYAREHVLLCQIPAFFIAGASGDTRISRSHRTKHA